MMLHHRQFLVWHLCILTCISCFGCVFYASTGSAANNPGAISSLGRSRAVLININGPLVEDASASLSLRKGITPVLARRITTALEYIRNDAHIELVILDLSKMSASSLATVSDVYRALAEVKKAGKTIYAFSENFTMSGFLLASVADQIWMDPFGDVELDGLAVNFSFFRRALEKYGINAYIFRVGEYKSAVEPFTLYSISDQVRRETSELLNEEWNMYLAFLSENRRFTSVNIASYALNRPALLSARKGNSAELALSQKLVDTVGTQDKFKAFVEENYKNIQSYQEYLRIAPQIAKQRRTASTPYVTVLYAVGEITRDSEDPNAINAESLVNNIKIATENPKTKALVLRIDSPGGEVFASEMIARAIEKAKEKIPVVISMAGIAASGGYWASLAGTEIWAAPTTLTGSIGVFAMMFSGAQFLKNHGIDQEILRTHEQAGMPASFWDSGPNSAQRQMTQSSVDFIYAQFLKRLVESGRVKNETQADALAQGRVYTGQTALKLGLVDKLGSLEDALKRAAELADLREYTVVVYSPQKSLLSRVLNAVGNPTNLILGKDISKLDITTPYLERNSEVYAMNSFVLDLP